MAFDRHPTVTAARIGNITIHLIDPDPQQPPGTGLGQQATAVITVVMSDGSTRTVRANIPDHFSATVVNQLRSFVASVRTKANAEIL